MHLAIMSLVVFTWMQSFVVGQGGHITVNVFAGEIDDDTVRNVLMFMFHHRRAANMVSAETKHALALSPTLSTNIGTSQPHINHDNILLK
jgi:hypothetical protein